MTSIPVPKLKPETDELNEIPATSKYPPRNTSLNPEKAPMLAALEETYKTQVLFLLIRLFNLVYYFDFRIHERPVPTSEEDFYRFRFDTAKIRLRQVFDIINSFETDIGIKILEEIDRYTGNEALAEQCIKNAIDEGKTQRKGASE